MKIFVVNLEMSSPNQLDSSEKIDDKSRKLNFRFGEKKRKEIHRVNQYHKSKIYLHTLDFHGLKICKEEQLAAIKTQADQAHEEMVKTDPSLHAFLGYFSLDMTEISKGDVYGQVLSAIRYQIVTEILDRLNKLSETQQLSQMSQRSREALLKMVDRLRAINILNDKEVETRLESIKQAIMTDSIAPMKAELVDEMMAIKRGGAYLKFRSGDTPTPTPAQEA